MALKDVIIQENRLQNTFSTIANGLILIDNREIQKIPASQLNDVLNYTPGVDIRTRGFGDVQSDVSINGGTFDQTLVLVNGARLSDPQTGHHTLNVPLTLLSVERLEVLKGAAARTYGQNAFAGALNIVTKKHTDSGIEIQGIVSDYNTYQTGGLIYTPTTDVSAQYQKSDGYRPNSDYEIFNFFAKIKLFDIGETPINFTTGFATRSFGASGFYSATNTSNEREYLQTSFSSFDAALCFRNFTLTPRFTFRSNNDDYYFDYSSDATKNNTRNLTNTYVYNPELNASWKNLLGVTGFSAGYEVVNYKNAKLLDHDRNTLTLNAEHRISFINEKLTLTPNLLFTNYSDFGSYLSPALDLGFSINASTLFYCNYNRVVRVPTYTDLYFSNKANNSNPNLKPELANNFEIGGKVFLKNVFIQAAVFRREGSNIIDRTKDIDTLPWTPTNLNSLTINGLNFTISSKIDPLYGTRISAGFNYILDYQFGKIQNYSRYALDFLSAQYILGLELPKLAALRNNFKLRIVKRINQPEAYAVLDWKSTLEKEKFNFFVQIQNLTNTDYVEQNNIPMIGRYLGVGFNLKFKIFTALNNNAILK